jgi:hypothetical protein
MNTNAEVSTLSALIRKGAAGMQQEIGNYFSVKDRKVVSCCSVGALFIGHFGVPTAFRAKFLMDTNLEDDLSVFYPLLYSNDRTVEFFKIFDREYLPNENYPCGLSAAIAVLNDEGVSFEEIAAGLEKLGL